MTATLEFRSLDLLANGIRLHLTKGFLGVPSMRGVDYVVAARPGRSSGNRVPDALTLVLEGYVTADTSEDWRSATDALLAVLTEDGVSPGSLVVRGPYYGLDVGASASISARVKNAVEGPIFGFRYQSWSIELESIDPTWVFVPAP